MAAVAQPLHIFQKDLRHLWPETLTGIVLLAAFAWATPYGSTLSEYSTYATALAVLLHVLIPLAWMIIIARLVHDETLVGDRQFWTSRPYHWASLLAAKILYVLVFIYVPFFLMQCYLLHQAGLHPMIVLPGLLHNLLLLTVILIVPILAIAAVTSSFPRLLLAVIGALVYLVVAAAVMLRFVLHRMPPPHFDILFLAIFILLPLLALIYQYATRKTFNSRMLLLATPLLMILLLVATPGSALIRASYPVASGSGVPKLSQMDNPFSANDPVPAGKLNLIGGNAALILPIKVEEANKDDLYLIEGTSAAIDQGEMHWHSAYTSAFGAFQISAARPYTVVPVGMPVDLFNKIHTTPVDLNLSVATEHLRNGSGETWKATLLPFNVPGNGLCSYPEEGTGSAVTCRFPFTSPRYTTVSGMMTPQSCATPPAPPVPGVASLGGMPGSPLDFNPVVTEQLSLKTGDPNPQHQYQLCPGTPLLFRTAQSTGRVRFELTEKAITLDRYAARMTPRPALVEPGAQPGPSPATADAP